MSPGLLPRSSPFFAVLQASPYRTGSARTAIPVFSRGPACPLRKGPFPAPDELPPGLPGQDAWNTLKLPAHLEGAGTISPGRISGLPPVPLLMALSYTLPCPVFGTLYTWEKFLPGIFWNLPCFLHPLLPEQAILNGRS